MDETPKKKKYGVYLTSETMKKVEQLYKSDNAENKSVFIERAINFYCGYLTAENYREYFPQVIVSTLKSSLDVLESRMASLLYKNAVEIDILAHIVAGTMEVSDYNLSQLRGICNYEVSNNHGKIKFEEALKFQKGQV